MARVASVKISLATECVLHVAAEGLHQKLQQAHAGNSCMQRDCLKLLLLFQVGAVDSSYDEQD